MFRINISMVLIPNFVDQINDGVGLNFDGYVISFSAEHLRNLFNFRFGLTEQGFRCQPAVNFCPQNISSEFRLSRSYSIVSV